MILKQGCYRQMALGGAGDSASAGLVASAAWELMVCSNTK